MLANTGHRRYARCMPFCYIESPVGRLALEADDDCVTSVRWAGAGESAAEEAPNAVLKEATRQLDRYFGRKLQRFDLPVLARGTDHQKRVWAMMRDIPFGETATYGGMAMALGSGPRAVGMACGRNPIPPWDIWTKVKAMWVSYHFLGFGGACGKPRQPCEAG